jgi:hypothetical protein
VVLAFVNLRDHGVSPDVLAVPNAVPLDTGAGVRNQAYNLVAAFRSIREDAAR